MLNRSILALCVGALLAQPVRAHDGEDHGAKAGAAPPLVVSESHVASSQRYELVVAAPAMAPLADTRLAIYLNDWATNAPIEGATLEFEFRSRSGGGAAASGEGKATSQPGVYSAEFRAPTAGAYNLVVKVDAALGADEFALPGFVVSATRAKPIAQASRPLVIIAAGAALLLILVAGFARFGRRRGAALTLMLGVFAISAQAHEGHDHAPSAAAASDAAEVELAKASQFLLGIRTALAQPRPLARQLSLVGRTAPRGAAEVELVAPQSGRVYFRQGATPLPGSAVTRGGALATLVVVDSLALRSPITGIVTAVHVADGQRVEAGQKLVSLLDPRVVWVHADVFGQDLALLAEATRAVVTSEGYPGMEFQGTRLRGNASTGDVPGAVEVWFEVPNRGGRLPLGLPVQVNVPIGGEEPLVLLPRDAVVERDGRTRVFVHTAPERFQPRVVTVVTRVGDRLAVRGLAAGERVVTRGASGLLGATPVAGK